MTTNTALQRGVDLFSARDVCARAAKHKGLALEKECDRCFSESFGTYEIDSNVLALLEKEGIRKRDNHPSERVIILEDTNSNPDVSPGANRSNFWKFPMPDRGKEEPTPKVKLCMGFHIEPHGHGVEFQPYAQGPHISPVERFANVRMFRVLAERDKRSFPEFVQQISFLWSPYLLPFEEFGCGGISSFHRLFVNVFKEDAEAIRLAEHSRSGEILSPDPNLRHHDTGTVFYVARHAQKRIVDGWRSQLTAQRGHLPE